MPASSRAHGHRTSERERQAIVGLAGVAGLGAAVAPLDPTSYAASDAVVLFAVGAVVTLAASRARRWTWLVLAGLAAVGSSGWVLGVAAAAMAVAFGTTFRPRRRIYGAIVGALAVQSLLRLDDVGFERSSAVLFALAVLPVLGSAYLVSPRRVRRRVHLGLVIGGAVVLVVTVLFGVAALLAYGATQSGVQSARNGLALARDGKGDQAATALSGAATELHDAHARVSSWWAAPAGAVPLLAQQANAVQVVTAEGARVADAAAGTARGADIHELRYEDGQVDVLRMRALEAPLADAAAEMRHAAAGLEAARSPWLVAPIADGIDQLDQELQRALPDVELAAVAAREAPGLLGADGVRHYLVLFTQPAEARGLGGFVGNWAELTAAGGRMELTRSGRARDLNEAPGRDERRLTSPPVPQDYLERYSRFRPEYWFQDITLSPDLPTVATVAAQLLPQMGGDAIDGVLVVDPYGLAALLRITGPIKVPGLAQPLTAENAADYLVREQYVEAADDTARTDVLDEAGRLTFEKLVRGDLPGPAQLADLLGPVVEQRRLAFYPFDEGERSLIEELGATGAFPRSDGGDFIEVVTQNKGNNKIDSYLQRELEYTATYAPGTGAVEVVAKVRLTNEAPSEGLPASIIGSNDQGLPPGTNRTFVSIYSPLGLREAKVDGQITPVEYQRELGSSVYSRFVDVPPGATVELELSLFGHLRTGGTYRLDVGAQPLVNPDRVSVKVLPVGDWAIVRSEDLRIDAGGASASGSALGVADRRFEADLARP